MAGPYRLSGAWPSPHGAAHFAAGAGHPAAMHVMSFIYRMQAGGRAPRSVSAERSGYSRGGRPLWSARDPGRGTGSAQVLRRVGAAR